MPTHQARLGYIRVSVAEFREGKSSLRRLVDDIEYTVESLDPGPVRDDLRPLAGTLETIYAVALDRGELDELPTTTVTTLNEVISTITSLIEAEPSP
ncbi:hypothetical protein [Embleya sp. NBC_00896]|uniref:hypothetical protein n=1 Tax=Embleya sp. NBC_00896 TaxID=2975961 RepID=UPI0038674521|nr:hypothetical protein OG928_31895 [Embleya sp. NBC_00896]